MRNPQKFKRYRISFRLLRVRFSLRHTPYPYPMKLSDTDIDNLLTDLISSDAEKHDKAERFYDENKAEILPSLLEYGERKYLTKHTEKPIGKFIRYTSFLPLIGSLYVYYRYGLGNMSLFERAYMGVCASSPFFVRKNRTEFMIWMRRVVSTDRRLFAHDPVAWLQLIADCNQPRYFPYKIDILASRFTVAVWIIEDAFYPQILQLTEEDASLFHERHHQYLRKQLLQYAIERHFVFPTGRGDYDPDDFISLWGQYALSILTALKHIG